jgi:hypothetical protein
MGRSLNTKLLIRQPKANGAMQQERLSSQQFTGIDDFNTSGCLTRDPTYNAIEAASMPGWCGDIELLAGVQD